MTRFYTFAEPMTHAYTEAQIAGMTDEELAAEIRACADWDADLLADLIWRAFPDYAEPWEVGDTICYEAAEALGVKIDDIPAVSGDDSQSDAARAIIDAGLFDQAVNLMDDEIREALHAELAPCSELEFLAAYMQRHLDRYGEAFKI